MRYRSQRTPPFTVRRPRFHVSLMNAPKTSSFTWDSVSPLSSVLSVPTSVAVGNQNTIWLERPLLYWRSRLPPTPWRKPLTWVSLLISPPILMVWLPFPVSRK